MWVVADIKVIHPKLLSCIRKVPVYMCMSTSLVMRECMSFCQITRPKFGQVPVHCLITSSHGNYNAADSGLCKLFCSPTWLPVVSVHSVICMSFFLQVKKSFWLREFACLLKRDHGDVSQALYLLQSDGHLTVHLVSQLLRTFPSLPVWFKLTVTVNEIAVHWKITNRLTFNCNSVHFNGHFSTWTQVSRYQNVSILDFIGARSDWGGGNNWSHKTCKALVKCHHQ